jgi:hypothetical protein
LVNIDFQLSTFERLSRLSTFDFRAGRFFVGALPRSTLVSTSLLRPDFSPVSDFCARGGICARSAAVVRCGLKKARYRALCIYVVSGLDLIAVSVNHNVFFIIKLDINDISVVFK